MNDDPAKIVREESKELSNIIKTIVFSKAYCIIHTNCPVIHNDAMNEGAIKP